MPDTSGAGISRLSFAGLAATTVAAVAAHIAGGGSMSATGLLLVLDHLFTLAAVAALSILLLSVGAITLRLARIAPAGAVTRVTFAMVLGSGVVATAILAVSAVAGVGPLRLGATLVVFAWLARHELRTTLGSIVEAVRELLDAHGSGNARVVAGAGLVALVAVLLLLALPPAADWDSLAYHLDVPAEWLAVGRLHVPEDNYHVAFVGLVHMLYLPLLAIGASSGPSILSAVFALLTALAAFALAAECFGSRAGAIALWLVWGSPILILIGVTPRIDVTLTLFLLTAHHALLSAKREGAKVLILGGAILGLAAGVKYLAVPYGLALVPLTALVAIHVAGRRPAGVAKLLGWVGLAAFAAWSPWLLKNWLLLGAPLFPMFTPVQVEPWLASLYANSLPSVNGDPAVFRFHEQYRVPFNLADFFFRPWRLTPDALGAFSVPNPALILVPVSLLSSQRRAAIAIAAPAVGYLGLVLLSGRGYVNLRYLAPVVLPFTILAASVLARVANGLGRMGGKVAWTLALALCIPGAGALAAHMARTPSGGVIIGRDSRTEFLESFWETASHMRAVKWTNAGVTEREKILLLFDGRGYYFDVPVVQDVVLRNWAYLQSTPLQAPCLEGLGITHVLVNDAVINYFRRRGARLETLGWNDFDAFQARCLELVHEDIGFRVFRVRRE